MFLLFYVLSYYCDVILFFYFFPIHVSYSHMILDMSVTPSNTSCRLLAGTLFVVFRGAGEPSLFFLPFVEPVVSRETAFFYSVFRGQAASG